MICQDLFLKSRIEEGLKAPDGERFTIQPVDKPAFTPRSK